MISESANVHVSDFNLNQCSKVPNPISPQELRSRSTKSTSVHVILLFKVVDDASSTFLHFLSLR